MEGQVTRTISYSAVVNVKDHKHLSWLPKAHNQPNKLSRHMITPSCNVTMARCKSCVKYKDSSSGMPRRAWVGILAAIIFEDGP